MDRSWMYQSRLTSEYLNGVKEFLKLAFHNASIDGKIVCPCVKCGNGKWVTQYEAVDHLVCDGFIKGYTKWIAHGETLSSRTSATMPTNANNAFGTNNNMRELVHDTFGISNSDIGTNDVPNSVEMPNEATEIFYKLLSDAEKPLYPGCKEYSKLSLLLELFHQCLGKWTNDSFTKLLKTFNRALPEGEKLPNSYHEAIVSIHTHTLALFKLHCSDEEVIDGAFCLLKAVIFRTNYSLAGSNPTDTREMDVALPLLLQLLDERDGTARAVVILIAKYCSITDSRCLPEVVNRLASGDVVQRRNVADVMLELFCISPHLVVSQLYDLNLGVMFKMKIQKLTGCRCESNWSKNLEPWNVDA
ncbi:hypothetical protein Vadar_023091 [Vaccinium darrowii]|uniref:Uncharacterized protein n=1 Tax=Vaccinium darrowii TaxID=229202 RepID=A0ACB7XU43_9ERIC|nr:hypothetical protein Vadar_023091 [Vaccinium darrowii]